MTEKRIHDIQKELNETNWQQLLDATAEQARQQAEGQATITDSFIKLKLSFETNYYQDYSDPEDIEYFSYAKFEPIELSLPADEVKAKLQSQLTNIEKCLMLKKLEVYPVVNYTDGQGNSQTYEGSHSDYYNNRFQSDPLPADVRVKVTATGQTEEVRIIDSETYINLKDTHKRVLISGVAYGGLVIGQADSDLDWKENFFRGILLPGGRMQFDIDDYGTPVNVELHYMVPRTDYEDMLIEDNCLQLAKDREELIVPEGVTTIDDGALVGMPSLKSIHLPHSIKKLGKSISNYYGSNQYHKLKVAYDGTLSEWWNLDSYTRDGYRISSLFIDGRDLFKGDLTLPDGLTELPDEAFAYCTELTSVTLPKSIVKIGNGAFKYCEKLQQATILGPAEIGAEVFISCDELHKVYLADGVKSIGTGCFSFCEKLEPIFIPKSVVEVGYQISEQNDGNCIRPVFACEAPRKPDGWHKDWALTYYDPRFGYGHGYDYFHPFMWGMQRPEEKKQSMQQTISHNKK